MGLTGFLAELRRRGVYKTAAVYAAIAWLLLEVLSVVFQNFGAPAWVFKVITTVFLVGFPIACLMAWGFDITPEGVRLVGFKVTKAAPPAENPPADDTLPVAATGAPVVAVLAFNNLSAEPGQEYFSDGIAEDIITDLSKLTELRVIARNSSFAYKGKPVDLKRIGRELGARYVLEGSVRRVGERVRVTSQLSDAADGMQVWAERYDRELTDICSALPNVDGTAMESATRRLSGVRPALPPGGSEPRHGLVIDDRRQHTRCWYPAMAISTARKTRARRGARDCGRQGYRYGSRQSSLATSSDCQIVRHSTSTAFELIDSIELESDRPLRPARSSSNCLHLHR